MRTMLIVVVLLALTSCAAAQIIHARDALVATAVASDDDVGDVLTFRFVWQKLDADGTTWVDQQDTQGVEGTQNPDQTFTGADILPALLTAKNDTWRCVAYAFDGEFWSDPLSAQVTIRGVGPKMLSITIEAAP